MIRIYLMFSYKSKNAYVATFTTDGNAIECARHIKASALFMEIDVFNPLPAEIPESASYAREFCSARWKEILMEEA